MAQLGKLKVGDFVLDPLRNVLIGTAGETSLEPKVVHVLATLAARAGEVLTRDELIDAVWRAEFGADERLTRAISLLRKAFGDERGVVRYIETVPKRGYRLVALVDAVTDREATVAPIPRIGTAPQPSSPPPTRDQAQLWWRRAFPVSVAGAAAAAALFVASVPGEDTFAADVVALRPPAVIGEGSGTEQFARQAHASLKRILASNHVQVVDENGPGAGSTAPARSEFSLSVFVEQTDEQRVINLYFDSRHDRQTLWSQRFVRPASESESLREEAGIHAAATLTCALRERRSAHRKPASEAFKVYLESCDPTEDWRARLTAARRLSKIAPQDSYGPAMEALAHSFIALDDVDLSAGELSSMRLAAQRAIRRARALDASSPIARIAELVQATEAERWRNGELLRQASAEHPSALGLYFGMLRSSGRLREALHAAEQDVRVNRLSPFSRGHLAIIQMQLGERELANRLFDEAIRLWPDMDDLKFYKLVNLSFYGRPEDALRLLPHLKDSWVRSCFGAFANVRRSPGRKASSRIRDACVTEDVPANDYIARMLSSLGRVDEAYAWLKAKSFDWTGATTFLFYPDMATFRRDSRFIPFIASSGLLEAWRETGNWPDFCRDPSLPYDCAREAERVLRSKTTNSAAGGSG